MSVFTTNNQSTFYKIGFWILILIILGNGIGHLIIHYFIDKELITLVWAEVNLLGAVILFLPYQRLEKWAWYTISSLILAYALLPIYIPDELGRIFLILGVIIAIAQSFTFRTFFKKQISP